MPTTLDHPSLDALPLIRAGGRHTKLSDEAHLSVQRADRSDLAREIKTPDLPDSILLSTYGSRCDVTMCLSPAMLVQMANTMLTDEERAFIVAPVVVPVAHTHPVSADDRCEGCDQIASDVGALTPVRITFRQTGIKATVHYCRACRTIAEASVLFPGQSYGAMGLTSEISMLEVAVLDEFDSANARVVAEARQC